MFNSRAELTGAVALIFPLYFPIKPLTCVVFEPEVLKRAIALTAR